MFRVVLCSLAALVVAAIAGGCTNATGSVQGGQLLTVDPCSPSAPATWTTLYNCYFGPAGVASCTAQTACHGASSEPGALGSGFVCGGSKESCWQGMTQQVDGGLYSPIVCLSALDCSGGVSDPTKTNLWADLHQGTAGTGDLDNMPCSNAQECTPATAAYTFMPDDLALISSWITQGGQDN